VHCSGQLGLAFSKNMDQWSAVHHVFFVDEFLKCNISVMSRNIKQHFNSAGVESFMILPSRSGQSSFKPQLV